MQLLTEAPAIGVDPGYGVVTEVKLVQRWKAIEGAAVYFSQAVILQVAVEKNQKELTDKQHWSNTEEFPTWIGILAIPTDLSTYPWGHVDVWASPVHANKLGLKHPVHVCICRVSVVWQQCPETCCLDHLWHCKHTWKPITLEVSSISLQWLFNLFSCMERTHHWDTPAWFPGIPRGRTIRSATHSFHVPVKTNLEKPDELLFKDQLRSYSMFKSSNFQRNTATAWKTGRFSIEHWVKQWAFVNCGSTKKESVARALCMQGTERSMRTGTGAHRSLRGVLAKM